MTEDGAVDDIVMHERRQMNEFGSRADRNGVLRLGAAQLSTEYNERRPQTFAPGLNDIVDDFRDHSLAARCHILQGAFGLKKERKNILVEVFEPLFFLFQIDRSRMCSWLHRCVIARGRAAGTRGRLPRSAGLLTKRSVLANPYCGRIPKNKVTKEVTASVKPRGQIDGNRRFRNRLLEIHRAQNLKVIPHGNDAVHCGHEHKPNPAGIVRRREDIKFRDESRGRRQASETDEKKNKESA